MDKVQKTNHFEDKSEMTREEIIEQQTFVYYETCSDEDIAKSKGFIDGAKWADKNPRKGLWDSEKIIEWLKQNIHEYYEVNEFQEHFDEMFMDLRKAMEKE